MKYIAIGKQVSYIEDYGVKVDFLRKSAEWIRRKKTEGVLECAYSYPSGSGFLIFNVGSHEELTQELIDFPLFCLSEFEVKPLCEFADYAEIVIDEFRKLGVYQEASLC